MLCVKYREPADPDKVDNGFVVINNETIIVPDPLFPLGKENERCDKEICLRKCCPFEQYLFSITYYQPVMCRNSTAHKLDLNDLPFQGYVNISISKKFGLLPGLSCDMYYINPFFDISFASGILDQLNNTDVVNFPPQVPSDYCVELAYFVNCDKWLVISYICAPGNIQLTRGYVYLSLALFFITLVVYLIERNLRKTMNGACLMNHTASLLIAYTLITIRPQHNISEDLRHYDFSTSIETSTEQMIGRL